MSQVTEQNPVTMPTKVRKTNPDNQMTTKDTAAPTGVTSAEKKGFAAVLRHLDEHGWGAPEWVNGMETDTARNDADELLNTDLWPIPSHGEEHIDALRAICHSEGVEGIFAEGLPRFVYKNPRLGFAPATSYRGDVVEGGQRYECELTNHSFILPAGAPIPTLFADAYEAGEEHNADEEHPGDRNPWNFTVHPAIVEAGPAFVLWAGWLKIRDLLIGYVGARRCVGEALRDAAELLTMLAGTAPEDVGIESPATAYRAWDRGDDGEYAPVRTGWEPAKRN